MFNFRNDESHGSLIGNAVTCACDIFRIISAGSGDFLFKHSACRGSACGASAGVTAPRCKSQAANNEERIMVRAGCGGRGPSLPKLIKISISITIEY